jgi:hypothetical protein
MKMLLAALMGSALLALAAPGHAQMIYRSSGPSWMQDDGSSSDYPTPMPSDRSGNRLNAQYRYGVPVPPGEGFPAHGVGR